MKKILGVGLVGAAVIGAVVVAKASGVAATPEAKTCIKLGELCGAEKSGEKLDQCVDGLNQAKKMSGEPAVQRSMQCVQESTTCMAATGCMMGGVGMGALGEMMKGFGSAISR